MALIPPFSFNCVVGLGVRQVDRSVEWVGTGTLVGRLFGQDLSGQNRYHIFLITNRHVLNRLETLVIRFNPRDRSPARDFDVPLVDTGGNSLWKGHPDEDVDLAALGMDADFLIREGVRYDFFQMDRHGLDLAQMRESGVAEGDAVFTLGFPMGIVDGDRLYVIARSGILARLRDTLEGLRKDFLIDAFIFPGNSGGPVLYKPEIVSIEGTPSVRRSALIGIVAGYLTFRDTAVSHQTGAPRIIFEENAGLAVVHTVDQVREVVERCFAGARIKEREPSLIPQ